MVVFRNAQGVFLPGMSDLDEYQYWRILKAGATNSGEPIMPGDTIRLCWAFKDQTTGFRDYTEDAFGRRQMRPTEDNDDGVLYLKVPWPRFEALTKPATMMMSSEPSLMPSPTMINVKTIERTGPKPYTLEDAQFRIDILDQEKGDSDDCKLTHCIETILASLLICVLDLLHGVPQSASVETNTTTMIGNGFQLAMPGFVRPDPTQQLWNIVRTFGIFQPA